MSKVRFASFVFLFFLRKEPSLLSAKGTGAEEDSEQVAFEGRTAGKE
jgi:hypothetical protein